MSKAILCSLLLLSACASAPQNEGTPATIAQVVTQIKTDLRYQLYDAQPAAKPAGNACGGIVSFAIDNVKVALTTSTDTTNSGTGSATLPVQGAVLFAKRDFFMRLRA